MICDKCGKDAECRTAKVFYSRILDVKQKSENNLVSYRTTTTTTYTKPEECELNICVRCIIQHKKRSLMLVPLYLLIFVSVIGGIFHAGDVLMGILGAIWLVGTILTIVALIRKKYQNEISNSDGYDVASKQLKKKLRHGSKKTNYEFWPSYPSHLKSIK